MYQKTGVVAQPQSYFTAFVGEIREEKRRRNFALIPKKPYVGEIGGACVSPLFTNGLLLSGKHDSSPFIPSETADMLNI